MESFFSTVKNELAYRFDRYGNAMRKEQTTKNDQLNETVH